MGSGLRAVFVACASVVGLSVLALSGAAFASTDGSDASTAASWSGHWSIVDYGTAGAATGGTYAWAVTLVQSGGSLKSTGTPTPYTVTGSASGSSAHFNAAGSSGYVAKFTATLSADGSSFKATWTDNQGNAGTAVGHGGSKSKKQKISGIVQEIDCAESGCTSKGLPGVKVTATGAGGTVSDTTGADGTYALQVKKGTWKVTPSLGDREFDPAPPTLVVDSDKVVNFTTCAKARTTSSVGSVAAGKCKKTLDVQVTRIKSGGDSGWTESSGKKYLGNATTRVGFTQPGANGDFQRQCRTGCMNIRIRILDAKTKHVVPEAHVQLTVAVADPSVTDDAPNGVLCPASEDLSGHCGAILQNVTLEQKRDLDLYYWLPGVVEQTSATLFIAVRVAKYPTVKKTVSLTLQPNVAFKSSVKLRKAHADVLTYFGATQKGFATADFSTYCVKALGLVTTAVSPEVTEEERSATLYAEGKVEDALKKLGKTAKTPLSEVCGKLDLNKLLSYLSKVAPWKLWSTFRPAFGFPVHGLLGANRYTDRLLQDVFGFSGFYSAFNDALVEYTYAGFDPKTLDPKSNPRAGDTISLKVFEVSHRLASGHIKDALYLEITGNKHGITPKPDSKAYAVDGYWPTCWLDPKINDADFTWFENSCKSDEP